MHTSYHCMTLWVWHFGIAMLRALGLKRAYEPKPRILHYAGAARGELLVFAGRTVDFTKTKEELSSTIQIFDQYLEQWRQLQTTGCPPKGLCIGGCCCISPSGDLYVYGGSDGYNFHDGFHKLSSEKWSQLSDESESDVSESDVNGPMKKAGCRMVCFNKKRVAIIGGYGPPPASLQPGASFITDKRYNHGLGSGGWTNEIHIFDTDECELK